MKRGKDGGRAGRQSSEQNGNKVDLMKAPQQRDKEQGEGGWP